MPHVVLVRAVLNELRKVSQRERENPHCELAAQGGALDLLISGAAKPWVAVSSVVSVSRTEHTYVENMGIIVRRTS